MEAQHRKRDNVEQLIVDMEVFNTMLLTECLLIKYLHFNSIHSFIKSSLQCSLYAEIIIILISLISTGRVK